MIRREKFNYVCNVRTPEIGLINGITITRCDVINIFMRHFKQFSIFFSLCLYHD